MKIRIPIYVIASAVDPRQLMFNSSGQPFQSLSPVLLQAVIDQSIVRNDCKVVPVETIEIVVEESPDAN